MKCQEVIELMQRYLDQDLDETEYNEMLGHMQQCPDCTKLFERLVALSRELEQLPKVTPAYSLVDAILPKLQRIDTGMLVEENTVAGHTTAPFAIEAKPSAVTKPPAEEAAGWRSRMRGLVSARIIGGVVAAGLVLGFFVFEQQQQQNSMKDAGEMLFNSSSSQNKSAAGGSQNFSAADTKSDNAAGAAKESASPASEAKDATAPKNSGSAVNEPPQAPAPLQGYETGPVNPSKDKVSTQTQAPLQQGRSGTVTGSQPQPQPQAGNPAGNEPKENGVAAKEQAAIPDNNSGAAQDGQSSARLAPPPVNGSVAAPEEPSSMAMDAVPGSDNAAPDAPASMFKQAPADQLNPSITGSNPDLKLKGLYDQKGISSVNSMSSKTLSSPDGAYTATVSGEQRIVITDKQGTEIYTSTHAAADANAIAILKWESGTKITYQISTGSETNVYVINVTDKTEMKK